MIDIAALVEGIQNTKPKQSKDAIAEGERVLAQGQEKVEALKAEIEAATKECWAASDRLRHAKAVQLLRKYVKGGVLEALLGQVLDGGDCASELRGNPKLKFMTKKVSRGWSIYTSLTPVGRI